MLLEVSPPVHRHPQVHSATQSHTKMVTGVWMALLVTKSICPLAQPPSTVATSPSWERSKGVSNAGSPRLQADPHHLPVAHIRTPKLWILLVPTAPVGASCWFLSSEPGIRVSLMTTLVSSVALLRPSTYCWLFPDIFLILVIYFSYHFAQQCWPKLEGKHTGPPCLGTFACVLLLSTASHRIIRTARLWPSQGLTTLNGHSPKTSSSLCTVLFSLVFLTHHFSYFCLLLKCRMRQMFCSLCPLFYPIPNCACCVSAEIHCFQGITVPQPVRIQYIENLNPCLCLAWCPSRIPSACTAVQATQPTLS